MLARIRPVAWTYLLFSLGALAIAVARNGNLTHRTIGIETVGLLVLLTLAVVPGRQRWAWWLVAGLHVLAAASILWEGEKPLPYIANLILLALVVSPQMREYVFGRGSGHLPENPRAGSSPQPYR